mmetsp:Transcript_19887/g.34158  ORF Transcript_19887/g.34158 Transcript_19887/m.34158 type:complete len:333 (-) Transcript_19887:952-1950(-)|eukprot:CAMPEP_0184697262 /NCGR_PEP_ID=MMETSP0313-20130426/4269_1 /TAXON_ID=2792 /ORGANISM="Porphyridium aerugineum, Strain SAG 1380-2" /LENGTH=332 /DNA_ID=CAMNT_0027156029 /DNA_START=325 /DNA_END=1323 /DNA_ORIENTATION=+
MTTTYAHKTQAQAPRYDSSDRDSGYSLNSQLSDTHNDANDQDQRAAFYKHLHQYMQSIGTPIQRLPTLGFKELDLWVLYREVTSRKGVDHVIAKKLWKEVADALNLPASCTDSGFRLRLHYVKYLEAYERAHFVPPSDVLHTPMAASKKKTSPTTPTAIAMTMSPVTMSLNKSASFSNKRPLSVDEDNDNDNSNNNNERGGEDQEEQPNEDDEEVMPQPSKRARAALALASPSASASMDYEASAFSDVSSPVLKRAVGRPEHAPPLIDFSKLDIESLHRYCQHYQLPVLHQTASKNELVASVTSHFCRQELARDESEILVDFVDALHRRLQR